MFMALKYAFVFVTNQMAFIPQFPNSCTEVFNEGIAGVIYHMPLPLFTHFRQVYNRPFKFGLNCYLFGTAPTSRHVVMRRSNYYNRLGLRLLKIISLALTSTSLNALYFLLLTPIHTSTS